MIYLTSDLHLCHRNILKYQPERLSWCTDLDNMNRILLNDICSLTKDDILIIVGDFMMDKKANYSWVLDYLKENKKCKLVLVEGNHDSDLDQSFKHRVFDNIDNYLEFSYNKTRVICSHYPMYEWNNNHGLSKSIHCYGHLHSKQLPKEIYNPRRINVGVDSLDYPGRLISVEDLIALVEKREKTSVQFSNFVI